MQTNAALAFFSLIGSGAGLIIVSKFSCRKYLLSQVYRALLHKSCVCLPVSCCNTFVNSYCVHVRRPLGHKVFRH